MNYERKMMLLKQLRVIKTGLEQTEILVESLISNVEQITQEKSNELVSSCGLLDFLAEKFVRTINDDPEEKK